MSVARRLARTGLLVALLGMTALVHAPTCGAAQGDRAGVSEVHDHMVGTPLRAPTEDGLHVRISLDTHRLYVMEGSRVVWTAVVGTGIGHTLEVDGQSWEFSTPRGEFMVQRKELDPVWNLPDWVFVQRGETVPPLSSPLRREAGSLGAAALYLTPEIAIHGTDEPDHLGHPVSHGCIRMTDDDVMRLYEEVGVGTPVIIY